MLVLDLCKPLWAFWNSEKLIVFLRFYIFTINFSRLRLPPKFRYRKKLIVFFRLCDFTINFESEQGRRKMRYSIKRRENIFAAHDRWYRGSIEDPNNRFTGSMLYHFSGRPLKSGKFIEESRFSKSSMNLFLYQKFGRSYRRRKVIENPRKSSFLWLLCCFEGPGAVLRDSKRA